MSVPARSWCAIRERYSGAPDTVRYRLRKMAEIANLQLDDLRKRLAMVIALAVDAFTAR